MVRRASGIISGFLLDVRIAAEYITPVEMETTNGETKMYSESARKILAAIANGTAYIETHAGNLKVLSYSDGEVTVEPGEWTAGCYHTFRFMFGMIRYPN